MMTDLPPLLASWLSRTEPGDWLLVALSPLFLMVVALEAWRWRGHGRYDWRDSLDSLNLGGIYTLVDVAFVVFMVLPAMNWVAQHRLTHIEVTPLRFALLYLGVEFCYYWFHRASHRIRWFWCAHVVHHGSEHMNFTTAMRQSWLYPVAGNWLFYLPMVWIGFEPRWVLLALSCNLAYQFFIHTQWVGKLHPVIEYVFNTPSHHRAHHGRNPRYIDRNYGGTLIVFDRLFGTFVEETEAPDYGLVRQVHSHNPVWLTVHEWVAMVRDMLQPGPLAARLKHLWAPPEWERSQPSGDNRAHAPECPSRPHDPARP
ncbi:sterol desaturase family protein [uncultured Aquabacterium sp.]|uniref:sterol desaturase family protein n=2 Tax=Pseudomonadota TaxID=1224 RepID=UPI0025DC8D7E|nr:sterol desaturase family protein [uncultured Aquabacterium sp.]